MTPHTNSRGRYGAYHRVSQAAGRDVDAETTMTDKAAFAQMDGWAQMRGVTIADRYLDWDRTGSTFDRPELNRLREDLRAGRIDGVVVAQVDRLSRADLGSALVVVQEILELAPGRLAILDLGIDPASEFGEFGLTILLALSRMQWRRYKRTWTVAQSRAVARGVWIGGVPFGYQRGSDGRLRPDEWAPVVTEAYQVAAGEGIHAAGRYLEREAPNKRWHTANVRRLLRTRVYLGESRTGEHVNVAAHEPLTTPRVWQAAQTRPRSRRTNGSYPLSGLACCGKCGSPLVGALQTVKGRKYRRYRCSHPSCKGGTSISADKLEAYVRDLLKRVAGDVQFRARFDVEGVEHAQQTLDKAVAELERYLADLEVRGLVGADAWRGGVAARQAAVDEARGRLGSLSCRQERSRTLPVAGELDDDEALSLAVAAVVGRLTVSPGRGAVGDRVGLVWADELDDRAGMLAA